MISLSVKVHTVHISQQPSYHQIIGRFFGQLPPPLFRQALNLKNTITSLDQTQSGSWEDVLTAENAQPWLRAHHWLLGSRQLPDDVDELTLKTQLHLGMFFTYLTTWLNESIHAPDTVFHQGYYQLVEMLQNEANHHFQHLFPPSHPFWQDDRIIKQAYQSTVSWQIEWQNGTEISFETADWQRYANRLAPLKLGITAAIHQIGNTKDLPDLWRMIDATNQAYRIQQDILAIRQDLLRGHLTYPIIRILDLAGLPANRPFNIEQILGAALLTGAIKKVCNEATHHLQISHQLANKHTIPGWAAYCDTLQQSITSLQSLFSLKASPNKAQKHTFLPYRDMVNQSAEMALGYLLADPNFTESIEINRGGLESLTEAKGIVFPLSFITYLLLENGHNLTDKVDYIFQKMEQLGYRYYENMAVAPDTDETAILLRLFKHSQNQEQHRQQLERPLQWLINNVQPDGTIPAFWDKVDIEMLDRMVVWENYCLTAEINTLLGLIAYDWPRFQSLIEKSAAGVFGRYLNSDFGTVAYYDLLYTLWQALALVQQLSNRTADPTLKERLTQANEKLTTRLALEADRSAKTPQQAAFLIMACLDSQNESHINPDWLTLLHKTQRYDGSWDNEPFFITCDRDGFPGNWYSSRTMTTVFCYNALNRYQKWQQQQP